MATNYYSSDDAEINELHDTIRSLEGQVEDLTTFKTMVENFAASYFPKSMTHRRYPDGEFRSSLDERKVEEAIDGFLARYSDYYDAIDQEPPYLRTFAKLQLNRHKIDKL